MKTMRALASRVAKLEGKKTQARIGEVREILSILSDLAVSRIGRAVWKILVLNGKARAAMRRKLR